VEPIILILRNENMSDDMRADAAWALGEMGDARANEALLQAMANDKGSDARMNAARSLRQIGPGNRRLG
jgi:HEAT repeat protein